MTETTHIRMQFKFTETDLKHGQRQIYVHVPCATDENEVVRVFRCVHHSVVMGSLARGVSLVSCLSVACYYKGD